MNSMISEGVATDCLPQPLQSFLRRSDIRLGGARPWDVKINNPSVFGMALRRNLLQLGEAYVRGDWDCDRIDQLVEHLHAMTIEQGESKLAWLWNVLTHPFRDRGSRHAGKKVAHNHYDIGNDLFEAMLDPRMTYSCGYWADATTLSAAQEAKLDLICRKLKLEKGMRMLDIGGGWGALAIHAARNYKVDVVMTTISENQFEEAAVRCAGLPIEVQLQDYRDTTGTFDAISTVGMFEHVGRKHHRQYMKKVKEMLAPDGLFLLHTIGSNDGSRDCNPWIDRWVFPGGCIPTTLDIAHAIDGLFVAEDWHNFGADYDRTLMAWYENFNRSWETLKDRYPVSIYRRWRLYLLGCAGSFRTRQLQLWQVVLSPHGVLGGYRRAS